MALPAVGQVSGILASEPMRANLNFRPNDIADSKIIVTEGYEAIYHRIVNIREDLSSRGTLLTGQPGIGTPRILLRRKLFLNVHARAGYLNPPGCGLV